MREYLVPSSVAPRRRPAAAKHGGHNRGQHGGGIGVQAVALIRNDVFQIRTCGPTGRPAEIGQRLFGHEEQNMRILLRTDLQAARSFGHGIIIHRHVVDPQCAAPVSAAQSKASFGHERHDQHAVRLLRERLGVGIQSVHFGQRRIDARVDHGRATPADAIAASRKGRRGGKCTQGKGPT